MLQNKKLQGGEAETAGWNKVLPASQNTIESNLTKTDFTNIWAMFKKH